MSGRVYLLLVVVCALWLSARAATQPTGFDFDEAGHLLTVAQIRQLNGLPASERFPDIIVRSENFATSPVTYHTFPPLPYLLLAGLTALARTDPTPEGVQGLSRASAALLAFVAMISAGLAVRNLQPPRAGWSASAVVTVGLALLPSVHSMGASVTASTWAFAAVGLTTAATTWAVRRNWSSESTLTVTGAAAFVVAVRYSAYPVLLLIPLAMLAARLSVRAAIVRLGAIAAGVLALNGWWLVRNVLVLGEVLGAGMFIRAQEDVQYFSNIVRESVVWRDAASAPWPTWTLLTSTDWLWVAFSRALVPRTWIDPLTIALWFGLVLVPATGLAARRIRHDRRIAQPFVWLLAAGGVVMLTVPFAADVALSVQVGRFAQLRDAFIVSIPLIVAVAALADLRHDRLRSTRVLWTLGLTFAAAANAGFMLAVLP